MKTNESKEKYNIMEVCVENEWRAVYNCPPSSNRQIKKICNFFIPCPILFKHSLICFNNQDYNTSDSIWGFGFLLKALSWINIKKNSTRGLQISYF